MDTSGRTRGSRFAHPERERRFLVAALPDARVLRSSRIEDLYVTGTLLRLRRVSHDDGTVEHKLTQKVPGNPWDQLTTMYLSPAEHTRLRDALDGDALRKSRHHVPPLVYDVFDGPLTGLVVAEIEFADDAAAGAYAPPLGHVEITADARFTGAALARSAAADTLRAAAAALQQAGA